MKKVILLGSSGSIGESTCKVARALPEKMKLVGLGVAKSTDRMLEQAKEFGVKALAVSDPQAAEKVKSRLPQGTQFYPGAEGLARMVEETEADMVLVAIVGTAGLAPALAALRSGKDLAGAPKRRARRCRRAFQRWRLHSTPGNRIRRTPRSRDLF
jgi:1-deoxy-D-xylulose-5-phosphate reductoisomerase